MAGHSSFMLIRWGMLIVSVLWLGTTSFMLMHRFYTSPFTDPISQNANVHSTQFHDRDFSPKMDNESLLDFARRRFKGCPYVNNSSPLFLDPQRSDWVYTVRKEHAMIVELIRCRVPFSFARYGDGEYLLARGWGVGEQTQAKQVDRWSWQGGQGRLGRDLVASLQHKYTNRIYIQAFPHPASSFIEMMEWLLNTTHQPTQYLSHALVWMGSNWRRTYNLFNETITMKQLEQPIILIINEDAYQRRELLLTWALDVIFFPDDGPNWWEREGERAARFFGNIARSYNGVLFLIAIGPVAEATVYHMSEANPNNQYVDIGSSMELWTKGASSRTYKFDVPEEPGWEYRKNLSGRLELKHKPAETVII